MGGHTLGLSIALVAGLLAPRAQAVVKTWAGIDGGSYSTPANWSPSGTPLPADSLLFANGAVPVTYDIVFDADPTVTQVVVATSPLLFVGNTRTLSLTSTLVSDPSRSLVIGRNGSGTNNAVLTSQLAQLNTTYTVLGVDAGSVGVLNIIGGTFSVSGTAAFSDFLIGSSGTGTVNVLNGGDVTVADNTNLATFDASVGNINIIGSGSTWKNTGAVSFLEGTGTIMVADGGVLTANGGVNLFGGKLAGNSEVVAAVTNDVSGTVAPSGLASSLGALRITGSYTQDASSTLEIELAGTTTGTFDRLNVSGAATLAGTLAVTLKSFSPPQNAAFDILDFGSRTGTFSTVSLPALAGQLEWDTSKLYVDGTIRVTLPGDFNNNGMVDSADYVVWRNGLGTTFVASDYNVWRSHFGAKASGSAAGAGSAVPEPGSVAFVCAATACGALFLGRKHSASTGRAELAAS